MPLFLFLACLRSHADDVIDGSRLSERCHVDDVIDGSVTSGSSGYAASMYPGSTVILPLDGSSYVINVMHTFDTSAEDVEIGCGNHGNRCIGSNATWSDGHLASSLCAISCVKSAKDT